MTEQNKNTFVSYWLLLITFLVALMIIIGGLTRLTDSGLSITKWDLISGIIPPLNVSDWEDKFSLYKKIPEYKLINSTMTLIEFKTIYWWEYVHRLLGRLIGLFYLFPLLFFTWKKSISKKDMFNFYLIFLLILFQGFIGWYMVKSGLVDRTDVSQYRLSLHLTLAFFIFILLLWNYLKFTYTEDFTLNKKLPSSLLISYFLCLIIQISIGAFVSGLDAGQIYQTWPLMNNNYYPDDSSFNELFTLNTFDNPSLMQFVHRNIAYLLFFIFLYILVIAFKNKDLTYLRKSTVLVFVLLLFQIVLGIFTVISGAQIIYASIHQIGSILLITASLILVFKNSKIN